MVGDNGKGVQACANCHGPGGTGSGALYPYLAGQAPSYLTSALGAWRDGTRNNDPSGQMPIIAKGLAPEDISALAAYYGAQPPRLLAIDAEHMAATGPLAAANPATITSGPQQATPGPGGSPAAGTGTEQGAPLTGGSQAPGGGGGTGSASTGAPQGDTTGPGKGSTPSGSTVR
jgi:cytochrome c553